MTTLFDFNPTAAGPFQFQPTLDGEVYTATVTWGLFGKRYYLGIAALDGTPVVYLPLIGSPFGRDISMTAGYFASTLVYRTANRQFEVSP